MVDTKRMREHAALFREVGAGINPRIDGPNAQATIASIRSMGTLAEDAATEIDNLRAQLAQANASTWVMGPCAEERLAMYRQGLAVLTGVRTAAERENEAHAMLAAERAPTPTVATTPHEPPTDAEITKWEDDAIDAFMGAAVGTKASIRVVVHRVLTLAGVLPSGGDSARVRAALLAMSPGVHREIDGVPVCREEVDLWRLDAHDGRVCIFEHINAAVDVIVKEARR